MTKNVKPKKPKIMIVGVLLYVALVVFIFASWWKIFTKAGKPGWAAIVPIYNLIVILEIIKKPTWWVVLVLLVPIVNIVILIIILVELSKAFGKPGIYALGIILLGIVFIPILGFGDAKYIWGDNSKSTEDHLVG